MNLEGLEVQTLIGSGAFGDVQLVVRKKDKKKFALKDMDRKKLMRDKKLVSIYREKHILKLLDHKNIIHLEGSFENQDHIYLLLELVEGDDLREVLDKNKRLEPHVVQHVLKELLHALGYMHDMGIFHADIKPHNVMVTTDWTVKLVDFGSSNYFKVTEKNKEVVAAIEKFTKRFEPQEIDDFNGTSYYASPELLDISKNSWQDDIWSLGVMLYQMLAGKLPFEGETEPQTFAKVAQMSYEKKPEVVVANDVGNM